MRGVDVRVNVRACACVFIKIEGRFFIKVIIREKNSLEQISAIMKSRGSSRWRSTAADSG